VPGLFCSSCDDDFIAVAVSPQEGVEVEDEASSEVLGEDGSLEAKRSLNIEVNKKGTSSKGNNQVKKSNLEVCSKSSNLQTK
jgi:hypothetical protein